MAYSIARPEATRLYATPAFLAVLEHPAELRRFDLWLAEWTEQEPDAPDPWSSWAAWQYSSTGTVQGIAGAVDLTWLRSP
jgi:lysozyme